MKQSINIASPIRWKDNANSSITCLSDKIIIFRTVVNCILIKIKLIKITNQFFQSIDKSYFLLLQKDSVRQTVYW